MTQALQMQMEVQKRLHEQLEVRSLRHLVTSLIPPVSHSSNILTRFKANFVRSRKLDSYETFACLHRSNENFNCESRLRDKV